MLSPLPTQAQPQAPQQLRVPAPDRHPATGLTFPQQIANAQKVNSTELSHAAVDRFVQTLVGAILR